MQPEKRASYMQPEKVTYMDVSGDVEQYIPERVDLSGMSGFSRLVVTVRVRASGRRGVGASTWTFSCYASFVARKRHLKTRD